MKLVFHYIKYINVLFYIFILFLKSNSLKIYNDLRYISTVHKYKVLQIKKRSNLKKNHNIRKMEDNESSFIDIGSNLTDKMFDGVYNSKKHENDLQNVLNRAKNNNVDKIIITCTCLAEIDKSLKICETYDPEGKFLYLSAGVHPTNCYEFIDKNKHEEKEIIAKKEYEEFIKYFKNEQVENSKMENGNKKICDDEKDINNLNEILLEKNLDTIPGFKYNEKDKEYLENLKNKIIKYPNRIVCIGEIGLDFDRLYFCSKYIQIKYFIFQLKLVQMFNLPMFLHMRNCSETFFKIVDIYKFLFEKNGGVIHSFTDKEDIVHTIVQNYKNLYIGVNGCSLKSLENINAVKKIPLNLLLLETDAPWCGVKKTHASYEYIKDTYEKRAYTNLKKIKNIIKCDDSTIFKERNEPYNIADIAEITYKVREEAVPFDLFCKKIRCNTLNLFKKLR
ncbi:TatD-like deoxyribonuclease, putative [Plasmodium reichenowi]|uniref:TatD-like deoxyribonuclease, putative n=1 Tax=Plasmodium reichenowi TaxID=5854 RepID=A0A060RMV3_PLARE|nr:TatD-like deoxyribonuclease, putative [Plasmodium reichenowi]KYO03446.1 TatD-like deoxyribonuclease, putative [Plasmodium reichenowi]CDO62213.1 TatD-like deoxyribonuclease, putative [Plasmodium reichenowi]SOV75013.1 TatD-like deoxyribonuclease, putative [Plasmodium reichenowi]